MANDRKISQLDPTVLLTGEELFAIVQPVDDPKDNRKVTLDQVAEYTSDILVSGHIIFNSGIELAVEPNLNFTNGLVAVDDAGSLSTIVKLGGALIENTNIDGAFELKFGDSVNLTEFVAKAANIVMMSTSASVGVRFNNGIGVANNLYVLIDGVQVELTAGKTFTAAADYSANFTALSYIHKGYADATYAPITGSTAYWKAASGVVLTANNTISGAFNIGFTNTAFGVGVAPGSITANTKVDIRGIGTTTNNTLRLADSSNSTRFIFTDEGKFYHTVIPVLDNALTDILIRDSGTGEIKYKTVSSITGLAWLLASGGTLTGPNTITQALATSGSPTMLTFVGAAHTTLTASSEVIDINYNLSATVQRATGDLTTQRTFLIQARTYSSVGASIITNASTVVISGHPIAGTLTTITRPCGLLIGTSTVPGTTIGVMLGVKATSGHNVATFEAGSSSTGFVISSTGNLASFGSNSRSIESGLTGGFLLSNTYSLKFNGSNSVVYSVSDSYSAGHTFNHTASVTDASSNIRTLSLTSTFAPTTGTNNYANVDIIPVYNFTGGTRELLGINYNPTLTAVTGTTHYALKATSGSVLLGHTTLGATTTRLQVRGIGTSTGLLALLEDNAGTARFQIQDGGTFSFSGGGTFGNSVSVTGANNSMNVTGNNISSGSKIIASGTVSTGGITTSSFSSTVSINSVTSSLVSFNSGPTITTSLDVTGFYHGPVNANNITGTHLAFHNTTGSLLIGHTALGASTTRVHQRGIGTTTGILHLWEDSAGTLRYSLSDNGLITSVNNSASFHDFTTTSSADQRGISISSTFTKSSGTNSHVLLSITPTINTTGTYTGIVYGIIVNPTLTSAITGYVAASFRKGSVAIGDFSAPTSTNSRLQIRANTTGTGNFLLFENSAASPFLSITDSGSVTLTPIAQSSGSPVGLVVTRAAHTGLTASTESLFVNFNSSTLVQYATGAQTELRNFLIQAPTISFVGASVTTDMATLTLTGASISGNNAIGTTNTHGLWIKTASVITGTGTVASGYGLTVNAPTGATNNYAAQFIGGNVGVGIAAPTHRLHVKGENANESLFLVEENGGTNILEIIEAAGVNKIGVFAAAPVAQQAGLTAITHTAPGTPDYALQDLAQGADITAGFGFATKDEGNTFISVVKAMHDAMKLYGWLT